MRVPPTPNEGGYSLRRVSQGRSNFRCSYFHQIYSVLRGLDPHYMADRQLGIGREIGPLNLALCLCLQIKFYWHAWKLHYSFC